ncbi:MAG TPA: hypothetical protein VM580_30150 [Labilithrix sp.]|nr:hypothetical protein [Labilithrix sp.]
MVSPKERVSMIIVYGTRLWGHADAVTGVGHVACRFFHIMFVPLIPIETVFMVGEDRGVKVPFSFKAALSGWLRGGALVGGIASIIGGGVEIANGEPLYGASMIVGGALSFAAFYLVGLLFGRCSEARRAELMAALGMDVPAAAAAGPAADPMANGPMPYGPQAAGAPPAGPPPPAGGFGQQNPYGAPQGYGPPQAGYGAPPAPQGFGPPPAHGGPPGPQGFGPAPAPQAGYGAPPAPQGFGPAPAQQGFGGPPQANAPQGPAPQNYGAPPPGGPGWNRS